LAAATRPALATARAAERRSAAHPAGFDGRPAAKLIDCRVAEDSREVRDAQDLRVRVFCREQGVPRDSELDGRDADAIHIVALDSELVIATCRLTFEPSGFRLGRMAVEADRRREGVGAALLDAAEAEASRWGGREVILHAQRVVEGFYGAADYVAEGGTFLEEGIEHVLMRKELQGPGA